MSDRVPPRPDAPSGPPLPQPPSLRAPPATWRPIEAIPVFLIILIGGALLGAPVALSSASCSAMFVLEELLGELAFVGAVVVWVRFVHHTPLAALGLPRRPLGDLAWGVGTGVALVLGGDLILYVTEAIVQSVIGHTPPQPQQVQACVRGAALVYLAPVVVLAAPLGEETFFRGFLYKGLRRRLSVWPAAVASAALFAAVHFQGVSFLQLLPSLFAVGMGLALVYEHRQSLLASMAAHATFNLVGFVAIALSRH